MAIFRSNAIWLPRIVAVLLLVFTIDVALAATCCPLPIGATGMTGVAESGPSDMMGQQGSDCPQGQDSSEHPEHNAYCLACIALVPNAQIPDLDFHSHSFVLLFVLNNAPPRIEHPFRPPINHLL